MVSKNTNQEGLSAAAVRELAEDVVREAIAMQARDLEKHLRDIHKRLQALEKQGR